MSGETGGDRTDEWPVLPFRMAALLTDPDVRQWIADLRAEHADLAARLADADARLAAVEALADNWDEWLPVSLMANGRRVIDDIDVRDLTADLRAALRPIPDDPA